jgi:hypothetical protein
VNPEMQIEFDGRRDQLISLEREIAWTVCNGNRIGPLFGVEINGERKNLFGSLDSAKELQAAVVAEGGKAVIFQHSEAEVESRTREAASGEFLKLGVQYYAAARAIRLLPVTGNLYHHALEMFLKAGLSRKYSLTALKRQFGHKLPDLWREFKIEFPAPEFEAFDDTIEDVEDFEEVRYPDSVLKHGALMILDYRGTAAPVQTSGPPARPEPEYRFYFDDVDRLIGAIFTASGKNPLFFTSGVRPEVQDMLARDNPVAKQLLMSRV